MHKPADGPNILRERGRTLGEECCRAVERGSQVEFDRSVYGHTSVKQALMEAQHGKCCYCEARIGPAGHGDVEHFRPKGAVRQSEADVESKPGYYWLAYTWSNLFLSCEVCNQSHKRSFFPLADAGRRARMHTQALQDESPLLLDPGGDDPERSIGFRRDVPFPRDVRGEVTIRCLKLDRTGLCESRADHLEKVAIMIRIIEITDRGGHDAELTEKALTSLQQMSSNRGVYTAAVREHLRARLGADVAFPIDPDELRRRLRGDAQVFSGC